MHSEFNKNFPLNSQKRINELRHLEIRSKCPKKKSSALSECVTLVIFKMAWILEQKRVSFLGGQRVK